MFVWGAIGDTHSGCAAEGGALFILAIFGFQGDHVDCGGDGFVGVVWGRFGHSVDLALMGCL